MKVLKETVYVVRTDILKISISLFLTKSHNVCLNTVLHFSHLSSHSHFKSISVLEERQMKQGVCAPSAGGVGFSLEEQRWNLFTEVTADTSMILNHRVFLLLLLCYL